MHNTDRLIFGLGRIHRIVLPSARQRLLAEVIELGFRAFDVAPAYGNGLNELELGIAVAGQRDQFRIMTKYGIPVPLYGAISRSLFHAIRAADKYLNPFYDGPYKRRIFSPDHLERSLMGSLKRLRTDYVDTLLIHEPLAPLSIALVDNIATTVARLKEKGFIREFGVAGAIAPTRNIVGHPAIQIVQSPLEDVERMSSDLSIETIAFGLYRYFMASRREGGSFELFFREKAAQLPKTNFIVSATSGKNLDQLRRLIV